MNLLYITIIAIAVLLAIAFLYRKIKKLGLREVAIKFMVLAEEKGFIEKLTGSEKFNYVFESVYALLPNFLKCFVTKALVVKFIQKVFDEIKIALDYKNTEIK